MAEHSDQGWDVGSIPSARSKWPGGGMANAMDGAPPINPGSTPGWASTLFPIGFAQSAMRPEPHPQCARNRAEHSAEWVSRPACLISVGGLMHR
jgi:hypothetical protein